MGRVWSVNVQKQLLCSAMSCLVDLRLSVSAEKPGQLVQLTMRPLESKHKVKRGTM